MKRAPNLIEGACQPIGLGCSKLVEDASEVPSHARMGGRSLATRIAAHEEGSRKIERVPRLSARPTKATLAEPP
jgi:hypothetical protein